MKTLALVDMLRFRGYRHLFTDGQALLPANAPWLITGNRRHSFPGTPLTQTLHGGPMTILLCNVRNYHAYRLEMGRFKISQKAVFISGRRWHTVIANQWLREDQDLTAIRGVCQ